MTSHQLIKEGLTAVRSNISKLAKQYSYKQPPTLIAVSKLKPASMIKYAYVECQQQHFGENYVQELISKCSVSELQQCSDLKFHLIGHLQSNKCNQLLKQTQNRLYAVHTIDSAKLATTLNKACVNSGRYSEGDSSSRLIVYVQVNTSGEDSKSGCQPSEAADVFKHIVQECPALHAVGLMTIGRLAETPQPDCFEALVKCRDEILDAKLDSALTKDNFELSMGMSGDYEVAMQYHATQVRVGSAIFGERDHGVDKAGDEETAESKEADKKAVEEHR